MTGRIINQPHVADIADDYAETRPSLIMLKTVLYLNLIRRDYTYYAKK